MVSIKKAQVREIASLMEGALMRNEDVVHQVIPVNTDAEYNVVQVRQYEISIIDITLFSSSAFSGREFLI